MRPLPRSECPPGRVLLRGDHAYVTMFEFLQERLQSPCFDVAAWKLELLAVHVTVRPIAHIDPTIVEIKKMKLEAAIWSDGAGGGRGPRAKAVPVVDSLKTQLLALVDDDPSDSDSSSDSSSGSDKSRVAADDKSARVSESGSSSSFDGEDISDAESIEMLLADGDEGRAMAPGGSDTEPEPLAAAVAPAELADGDDGAMEVDEDLPAAGRPAGRAVAATLDIDVPHGYLKYYAKTDIVVAHCLFHGDRMCRMTRSLKASRVKARAGQGRPLGLMLAWLGGVGHAEDDSMEAHKKYMPAFDERAAARTDFEMVDGHEEWLALERPARAGEANEPEAVP